jgi:hypothetical protein
MAKYPSRSLSPRKERSEMADKWIQGAREGMERKGSVGKFGKATPKKIARMKKKGGVAKKEAVFASNMKKIARKRAARKRY